jgi:hypothetical protein
MAHQLQERWTDGRLPLHIVAGFMSLTGAGGIKAFNAAPAEYPQAVKVTNPSSGPEICRFSPGGARYMGGTEGLEDMQLLLCRVNSDRPQW